MQSSVSRGSFVLKIQRKLCHPRFAREISGLSIEKRAALSQRSRNLSGLFWVLQFPLYFRNCGIPSHQTLESSWCLLRQKHVKRPPFSALKSSPDFRETRNSKTHLCLETVGFFFSELLRSNCKDDDDDDDDDSDNEDDDVKSIN